MTASVGQMAAAIESVRRVLVDDTATVTRLCYSSRDVDEGALFFALRGSRADGHAYIDAAIEAGAVCIVAEQPPPDDRRVSWIQVRDSREAMAQAAAAFFDNPSTTLKVAGVTGTNGKTTTTFLLHYLLSTAWHRCGMLGTVHYDLGDTARPASHTTPESVEMQSLLAEMVDAGCRAAVMEVSSHALTQKRVSEVAFDVGIFTNLSQDHLDYHGSMESYFEVKAQFAEALLSQGGDKRPVFVVNRDDIYGQRMVRRFSDRLPTLTYGMGLGADYRATNLRSDFNGTQFQLEAKGRSFLVRFPLIGRFNVSNALAALTAANALKLNLRESVRHLEGAPQVPGRLESIEHGGGFKIFVDYAHTPDALENVLKTVRALSPNRVITVFGCGGDRDRAKRPMMGRVAEQFSDFSVITSDNPRTEDPESILQDIAKAYRGDRYVLEVDRQEAIRQAVRMAERRDIVVVAGKGHEATQTFADRTVPFDDREEVVKALLARDLMPNWTRGGGA